MAIMKSYGICHFINDLRTLSKMCVGSLICAFSINSSGNSLKTA